jgi:predicted MPP superfamily phosphohydrolase
MPFVSFLLFALAGLGHVAACVFVNNRLHAHHLPRALLKSLSLVLDLLTVAGPCLLFAWWLKGGEVWAADGAAWPGLPGRGIQLQLAAAVYFWACVAWALLTTATWLCRTLTHCPPAALVKEERELVNTSEVLSGPLAGRGLWRFAIGLPYNQVLQIEVNTRRLWLPRLPPELEGLSILHLSDLHFTGRIAREYFEHAVALANAQPADIAAVTGDLLDRAACFDWLSHTLGKLQARHGAFFILGNHDQRLDHRRLREVLRDCGQRDVGGRTETVDVRGRSILLAGNELPWFRPAPTIEPRGRKQAASADSLRILLSHTPDQLQWARRNDFDLMLAGHTHGGQIRFPVIGPVVSPSRHGVKYASGVFHEPPTVLHVSRGLSAKTPLRFGCPPEITRLVLTAQPALPAGAAPPA